MRVLTWNVNSIRTRLPRLLAMLEREEPDIVCLQEIKVPDDGMPLMELSAAGYGTAVNGQSGRNGVAILAREEPKEIARVFPGDPTPEDARFIVARVGDVTVASVYVINGQVTGSPAYVAKLEWLKALRSWIATSFQPDEPLVVAGDFNVCSDERDLWDPAGWEGHCHFTEPERTEVRALADWGMVDLFRIHTPEGGHFSWWDYRAGNFHKRMGLRIDLMFATDPLARRCTEVRIDRNERRPKAGPGVPSDHAPVIATFDE